MKTCKDCKNFLGMGDWSLCCKVKPDLCYEDSEGCENFSPKEECWCKSEYFFRTITHEDEVVVELSIEDDKLLVSSPDADGEPFRIGLSINCCPICGRNLGGSYDPD